MSESAIPLASLVIAGLAVFVGPFVSWRVAKKQIENAAELAKYQMAASAEVAKKQMLGPMRQAWINELRALVAEIVSDCLHYFQAGYEDREDRDYQRIALIEHKLALLINPKEELHQTLLHQVRTMVRSLEHGKEGEIDFINAYETVVATAQAVLKTEWNVVKDT